MTTITITVLRQRRPISGKRVTLHAEGFDGGVSTPQFTDVRGVAVFRMGDRQGGFVFVDGSKKARWGACTARNVTISL